MTPSDALERLYRRQSERLLSFFVRRTADPQIAADLWAETFAQMVAGTRRRGGLTGHDESDAALLYTVARRQLALYYRRGYAEKRALNRLDLERPDLGVDPASHLEALCDLEELRDAVGKAVAEIPSGLSQAVRLRIVDQRSYADVAAALAISEPAARARVSRGLKALADLLPLTDPTSRAARGLETT
ncbi:sigma-70 family RNA polymerase sigma factor [Patulibacter sp. NPDC049589]|uniref:RNA polymerase sigma factor n=1 Tax=Patulibacter sp. NPDC049589 TaxID=3154731 RepID=UPI00342545AE